MAWRVQCVGIIIAGPVIIWLVLRRRRSSFTQKLPTHASSAPALPLTQVAKAPRKTVDAHAVTKEEREYGDARNSAASNGGNTILGGVACARRNLAEIPRLSFAEQRSLEELRANLSSLGAVERLDPYAQVQRGVPQNTQLEKLVLGSGLKICDSSNVATNTRIRNVGGRGDA
jgi:hypothetical protein